MRLAAIASALAIVLCVAVFGAILFQKASLPVPAPAPPQATPTDGRAPGSAVAVMDSAPERSPMPADQASPMPAAMPTSCSNPDALGVSRVVEIDTTGGPGFGFEHFKSHDFLREGEVVLTFDDGPWPKHTPAVLAALAAHCTKAIFFPIGKHATYEPGILKQVAAAGHAIGSHTWSHQDLSKKSVQEGKDEIEKGISAVRFAVGAPAAPYFRFPALRHPPELVTYLGERNVGIFSTDFDSFDFKMRKPEQVRQAILAKLKKHGKGMALMHDFQQATAAAAAEMLNDLKAAGYRIVFMKPKSGLSTIAAYDEAILKESKLPTLDGRPTSSVVRTINE
jgi:peptidoglycan/xylan/chitin deacetylase (PgdA/CDA1 family)